MSSCVKCPFQEQCTKSFCMQKLKKNKLFDYALLSLPQRQHVALHPDSDGTDKKEFQQLKEISENIIDFVRTGNGLYLHSQTPGCGKTQWALRMIQKYIDKIWYSSSIRCVALFINIPKFFLALKDSLNTANDYINHIKQNIFQADLVVWDEIGTKILSDFEHEYMLSLIDTRLNEGKANIYTSNLAPVLLKEKIGDRLYSRVINNSTCIELHGVDKRGLK